MARNSTRFNYRMFRFRVSEVNFLELWMICHREHWSTSIKMHIIYLTRVLWGKQGKNNVPHVTLAWQTVVCRNEFKKGKETKERKTKSKQRRRGNFLFLCLSLPLIDFLIHTQRPCKWLHSKHLPTPYIGALHTGGYKMAFFALYGQYEAIWDSHCISGGLFYLQLEGKMAQLFRLQ